MKRKLSFFIIAIILIMIPYSLRLVWMKGGPDIYYHLSALVCTSELFLTGIVIAFFIKRIINYVRGEVVNVSNSDQIRYILFGLFLMIVSGTFFYLTLKAFLME